MVVLARSALAGALLASVSVASPVAKELDKKDVDTRYPYNGPTVVIGMCVQLCSCTSLYYSLPSPSANTY